MDAATLEVLAKLPSPRQMMGIADDAPVRPTPGFANPYNLVEDGRTAEQIVLDFLRERNPDGPHPVRMNAFRGPRGHVIPEVEVATEIIRGIDELEEEHKKPAEERMRKDIAQAEHDITYAMHLLGHRPRDVRNLVDPEAANPTMLAALMGEAAGVLDGLMMTLGNWTRNERTADGEFRFPYGHRRNENQERLWSKLAELEGVHTHGFSWNGLATAPTREWIIVKPMAGNPMIVKSGSDTLSLDDERELVFTDTEWLTLYGTRKKINAHGAQWMRLCEQPSFDDKGNPRFRRFD